MNFLAVFIGGGLGSIVRYGVSLLLKKGTFANFPLATLLSNVIATALLTWAVVYFQNSQNQFLKLMIMVGFCGGFSTFSTFSYETVELFKTGHSLIGVLNIIISVALCVFIGILFSKNG